MAEWSVRSASQDGDNVILTLGLDASEETRKSWPYAFALELKVSVGSVLAMTLSTHSGRGRCTCR